MSEPACRGFFVPFRRPTLPRVPVATQAKLCYWVKAVLHPVNAHQCLHSPLTLQDRPNRREGLLLAPGFERVDRSSLSLFLQLIDAIGQVAHAGQHGGAFACGRTAGVLTQGDITPVMGPVFNRRPVTSNDRQNCSVIPLVDS